MKVTRPSQFMAPLEVLELKPELLIPILQLSRAEAAIDPVLATGTRGSPLHVERGRIHEEGNETNDNNDASLDNCIVVDYIQPSADRTPELAKKSSDFTSSLLRSQSLWRKKPQPIHFHHSTVCKDNKRYL